MFQNSDRIYKFPLKSKISSQIICQSAMFLDVGSFKPEINSEDIHPVTAGDNMQRFLTIRN